MVASAMERNKAGKEEREDVRTDERQLFIACWEKTLVRDRGNEGVGHADL